MQWEIPSKTIGVRVARLFNPLYQPIKTMKEIWYIHRGHKDLDVRRLNEITKLYIKLNMPNKTTSVQIPNADDGSFICFHAFLNCTGLKGVAISMGAVIHYRAFEGCTGLTQLVIPKGAFIDREAFWGCIGLKEVVIHEGARIKHHAFHGSTSLTKVDIHAGAFIDRGAFEDCTGLTEIIIRKGEGACISSPIFLGCTGLRKIVISESARIDGCGFQFCEALTELIIHKYADIGRREFEHCIGLKKLVIPEGARIRYGAFWDCIGLTELIIHKNAIISENAFSGCTGLTKLVILEGTTINSSAFSSCTGLTEVIIHKGADVNGRAFWGCDNLSLIVVPDDFPRDNLPVGATIVTHAEHKEMNDFYSEYGFQDLELKDKIKIYNLCHSGDEVIHENFEQLSHLSVVTMLNFIQAYSEIPSNIEQGKTLLKWTMGKGFVDAHPDKDVSDMISIARDEGLNSQLQEYMSVKDWCKTHPVSKNFKDSLTSSEEKSEDDLGPMPTSGRSG